MMKNICTALASVLALGLAQTAWAAQPSDSSTACTVGSTSVPFVDCAGSFGGNLGASLTAAQIAVLNTQFGDNGFQYNASMVYSKSDAVDFGVFSDNGKDLSLSFDSGAKATGLFVIGLKQANHYSFYLFDGGTAGIGQIDLGGQYSDLGHAVYIGNAANIGVIAQAVPEPQSYALLLAGLGAVGFIARRRNKAK
jgi:hypothetical protein